MADYGIKISKEGFDVLTAALRNLILSISRSMYKVFATAQVSLTDDVYETVDHSLGYEPMHLGYVEKTPASNQLRLACASFLYSEAEAYVDDTELKIRRYGGSGSYKGYYYIFYDEAGA